METGDFTNAFEKTQDMALIATAGDTLENSGLLLAEQTCKAIASFNGGKFSSLLVPSTPHEPGEIESDNELKQKAGEFGKQLASC